MPTLSVTACNLWHTHTHTHTHRGTKTDTSQWSFYDHFARGYVTCHLRVCICVCRCVFCPLQMYVLWLISVIHPHIPQTHSLRLALYLPLRLSPSLLLSRFRTHLLSSVPQILPDIFPIILQYQEVKPCRGQTDISELLSKQDSWTADFYIQRHTHINAYRQIDTHL